MLLKPSEIYQLGKANWRDGWVLDAGANIGVFSAQLCRVAPDVRIVAVELEHQNFRLLQHNTRHCRHIKYVHAALWGDDDRLEVCAHCPGRVSPASPSNAERLLSRPFAVVVSTPVHGDGTEFEALRAPAREGRQGATAALGSRGTPVPPSPPNRLSPRGLRRAMEPISS